MNKCALCLQDLPLFEGLSRKEFPHVCVMATKRILSKGEYLFHQGDPAETLYLIKKGTLKLVQYTEEGGEVILNVVGRGDVLGESALFQRQQHFASAVALEHINVCSLSLKQFEQLILKEPDIAMKIIASLGQKLYLTMQQLGNITKNSVPERLTRVFLQLAHEYGEEITEGHLIPLNLTQQDLANMVGASRIMVAQVLKQFQENGFIVKKEKQYIVQDRCLEKHFR